MPRPTFNWRHVILGTHGSWLPGDPRGFHSRDHRLHSSGDYKNPPPFEEHAGLRDYVESQSATAVLIHKALHPAVGSALIASLQKENCRVLCAAVAGLHVHILTELPANHDEADKVIARTKGRASHAVRLELPGRLWSQGATMIHIRDESHHHATFRYILKQPDAWIWDFREQEQG